ncbi:MULTISPECIES: glycosyltransferase family 2 protein [Arcicella]|uniref:Glycosyltransferase family 2 protein n=1 Tax=Arcicella aquatica TaxID=217141 RepID=A0ABU5QJ66_9BACT|nr:MULTISPECIES: glycosyltransferase family 2 protein [Arcicella]MDR6814513.1 dolichol-phosphate mannosyltransferase [Arcicella sp. BE140]MEA5257098.1 glycosyltransferase family 2 protein [Arcicella aquatica]
MNIPQISIIAPLYNESETFPFLIERLNALMDSAQVSIEIVLVDDGSRDNTAELMQALALSDERYHCLFLARNHGHQLALTAGLAISKGSEAVMVIDGDLQDPPELLLEFYPYLKQGYDVVYAVRKQRKEGFVKRSAYYLFYRLLKSIAYVDIPLDSGDFALMSRRVVNILNKMPEESRYLRGMRTWVGFKQIGVEYAREERQAGESKYSFKQLFKLAYSGIFNFSEFPIKFVTRLGLFAIVVSLIYFISVLIKKYYLQEVIEGFPALLFMIILFSGVQLLALGVLGEYILRVFFQSKNRPLFIIRSEIQNKEFVE